jgi:hypothetical protein
LQIRQGEWPDPYLRLAKMQVEENISSPADAGIIASAVLTSSKLSLSQTVRREDPARQHRLVCRVIMPLHRRSIETYRSVHVRVESIDQPEKAASPEAVKPRLMAAVKQEMTELSEPPADSDAFEQSDFPQ